MEFIEDDAIKGSTLEIAFCVVETAVEIVKAGFPCH